MLRAVPSLLLVLCCGFQSTRSFVFPAKNQGQSRQLELQLQQGGFAAEDPNAEHQAAGLYRPFVEHAWKKLGPLLSPVELRPEFHTKSAIAKGMPEGTVVKITVGAMQGSGKDTNIKYARYALLETLLPGLAETTSGIQVLNLVIFPTGTLPVWGVDLVSLPGDKHLLAMDVQPMSSSSDAIPNSETFKAWHRKHVEDTFEWGGDLPEAAAKYFSPFCLWTRLNGPKGVYQVQTQVMKAFEEHLDMYLEMMASPQVSTSSSSSSDQEISNQGEYLDYRLANDPARPMLKSLYGPEWTERLLTEVLFPK